MIGGLLVVDGSIFERLLVVLAERMDSKIEYDDEEKQRSMVRFQSPLRPFFGQLWAHVRDNGVFGQSLVTFGLVFGHLSATFGSASVVIGRGTGGRSTSQGGFDDAGGRWLPPMGFLFYLYLVL